MGEDEHVRRQSGNALNFAAATVKRNRCSDCIVFHDILSYIYVTRSEKTYHFAQKNVLLL